MVKRQREKQYNSAREQLEYAQIRSGTATASGYSTVQRRLPWGHCALTLLPFENPVCVRGQGGTNSPGIVFDNAAIVPFVLKHRMDPVTGDPLSVRDLITLHMDRDMEDGRQWQCPILTKHLNDHTKVVAIVQPNGTDANVYSYQAYYELNVKARNYEDLMSSTKFDPQRDVIILHDPDNEEWNRKRDINTFYHIRYGKQLGLLLAGDRAAAAGDVQHSKTAQRVLEQLQKNKEQTAASQSSTQEGSTPEVLSSADNNHHTKLKILASDVLGVQYTTGKAASSFTSTATEVNYEVEDREATSEELLQSQFRAMRKRKQKGYVHLKTNLGLLTLELHCDMVPRTCTSFLGLCRQGRYNGTTFHRLIPNFMIQGGKAMEPQQEDSSIWGGDFVDEFDDRLQHSSAGVVSMANSGPNTNRQQFFVTFKSCNHLDRKHSVFGTVIEGMDLLTELEKVQTDKKNRPVHEIKILSTEVVKDPAQEAHDAEQRRFQGIAAAREQSTRASSAKPKLPPTTPAEARSDSVGRYLKQRLKEDTILQNSSTTSTSSHNAKKDAVVEVKNTSAPSRLPPPPKRSNFGDFSGW